MTLKAQKWGKGLSVHNREHVKEIRYRQVLRQKLYWGEGWGLLEKYKGRS